MADNTGRNRSGICSTWYFVDNCGVEVIKGEFLNGVQTYKFYLDDVDPDKGEFHQFIHEWDYKNIIDENKKLQEQLGKAEEVIEFYANRDNYDLHSAWGKVCVVTIDTDVDHELKTTVGGKRARKYFKEKER